MNYLLFLLRLGLAVGLSVEVAGAAMAQQLGAPASTTSPRIDSTRVFTYVEQMPSLPSGGGAFGIVREIQRRMEMPAEVREGRVFVYFVVGPSGAVRDAQIRKGLSPAIDAAVLAGIARLPRFIPGRQNGQAVSVSFILPINISGTTATLPAASPATSPARPASYGAAKVYTYVEQMPELPGKGSSNSAIVAAIRERVVGGSACNGRVFVAFTVKADGLVDDAKIVKELNAACDAAVLAAVAKLHRFKPARQNGEAVGFAYLGVVIVFDQSTGK